MPLTVEEIGLKVEAIALPLLKQHNIELVELRIVPMHGEVRLEFTADKPTGGINIQECVTLNRAIVEAITLDGFLGEDFSLEFSSPGLDRPLSTISDFKRNLNRNVRFLLNEAIDGKKELVGVVIGVDIASVKIFTKKKKEVIVSLSQIIKAMLVI